MKFKYFYDLYFSKSLEKPPAKEKILQDLDENKLDKSLYLLVLSKNPSNSLEFFKVSYLEQEIYDDKSFFVIGFAKNYNEARELVLKITEDVVTYTGGTDIRKYFEN
jgi:hypothetical protein